LDPSVFLANLNRFEAGALEVSSNLVWRRRPAYVRRALIWSKMSAVRFEDLPACVVAEIEVVDE